MTGIRRYFRNLWSAVVGRDPYRQELDEITERYEKTAVRVAELGDLYEKAAYQMTAYQTLVEVLRQSIRDKDEMIARMNELYKRKEE